MMSEKILRLLINLFVSVWVARYLGPAGFGSLNFALSFFGLFSAIGLLGLDQIVVRDLVRHPAQTQELLASAFWLKIFGTLLMWAGMFAVWPFLETTSAETLMIMWVAGGAIFQSFGILDFHFQALVKARYSAWAQTAQVLAGSITKIILILNQAELHWFAMVYGLEFAIQAIMFLHFHHLAKLSFSIKKGNLTKMLELLRDSWPLMLSGVAVGLYMRIDQVMIQQMIGPEATGQYAAAVRISEAWYFVPIAICNSIFPSIIKAREVGKKHYHKRLEQLFSLMIWLGIAVAIPVSFLAPWAMNLLYGAEFLPSASVLQIHIWAGIFVAIGVTVSKWEVSESFTKFSLFRTISGGILNLFLNIYLIGIFGLYGAAISTLFSYTYIVYGCLTLSTKSRTIFHLINRSTLISHVFIRKNC